MQWLLAALFLISGFLVPLDWGVQAIAALFLIGSFLAATHDIAIDGYYLEALDTKGQSRFVGYRVMAYRIAMMTGTGLIVTIGTTAGWHYAFSTAGILLGAIGLYHLLFLPRCEKQHAPIKDLLPSLLKVRFITGTSITAAIILSIRMFTESEQYKLWKGNYPFLKDFGFAGWISVLLLTGLVGVTTQRNRIRSAIQRNSDSFYARAFITFMDRKYIGLILSFIILLRTGEFLLSSMVSPFMVDLGLEVHFGWISAAVGLPASIGGALWGGWLISRYSLKKMIIPFLLAQNVTNLVYMGLAFSLTAFIGKRIQGEEFFIGVANLINVAAVHGFDQFAGGLGTAVLMTFLMRICGGEFKAAHFAIGSGLMSLSGLFTGVASGFLAASLGYGLFFGFSFLLSIPGMILAYPALKAIEQGRRGV